MDISWVTERIGLGGGIWSSSNMEQLAQMGVTHVLNMQHEFDDRPLAEPYGIKVLWNPTEDDFLPKSPELLQAGSDFAMNALNEANTKIYVHCAAGVHRAPMMTLAILGVLDWPIEAAMELVETKRPVVDFAEVYVDSVRRFLEVRARRETRARIHH
jgi:protein-tyrosine phosphatase